MVRGRNDWLVELTTIKSVEDEENGYSIGKADGWHLYVTKDECDGFVPKVGDWILTEQPINNIATIIIEGRVLRRKTPKQIEKEHKQFSNSYRLKQLEAYIADGDALKERVKKLHPSLQARMARFDAEGGVEFWIDSAPYEMAALEGAQALLNKVTELGLYDGGDTGYDAAVEWIENWWALNTKEHNYNYKRQMELVPDFGDGHSGNTAGAAYGLALRILQGLEV